ncbi:endoribonuclease L-PSP [Marinobacter santoriniensis NKSG1]|uniref:Endoribonuclease L-PSP n=1 Tax=Marinobacter santoriniensis NKSG1 TaxID=1288826 RepID=M7DH38_9GAMM|nr:endoribonuclease L-PSP [Marinobacter santoriniensis NKSG1]
MANIGRGLNAEGPGVDCIFKITGHLIDMNQFESVIKMRERYFDKPWPADTTVGVSALSLPELMVELDVIATRS